MNGLQMFLWIHIIWLYWVNPKEPSVLKEHNLNIDRLCKLEKWSNGAEILVCGGQPSYLSDKTILTQKKFMVSEL